MKKILFLSLFTVVFSVYTVNVMGIDAGGNPDQNINIPVDDNEIDPQVLQFIQNLLNQLNQEDEGLGEDEQVPIAGLIIIDDVD